MTELRMVSSSIFFPPTLPKKPLLNRSFKTAAAYREELSIEISQEN